MSQIFKDDRRIILAPMAGVGDVVFRHLCRELGAQLTYTEMVSAKALSYANEKTIHLLDLSPLEDKVSVQLFGHEPETLATQARWVEETLQDRLFAIDVNMGCPARKIAGKGDGAALMRDPDLAVSIIKAIVSSVSCPVTVKFRRGYEEGHETALDFALRMEDAGASAVAIHGRYAQQFYRGKADWDIIRRCKDALSIPVIGNGDIVDGSSALEMLRQTNCDAVMVGRGAQGNPWIFKDIASRLQGGPGFVGPSPREKMDLAIRHAELLQKQSKGGNLARMRKHAMWYVAGTKDAASTRRKINDAETLEDFTALFNEACRLTEEA